MQAPRMFDYDDETESEKPVSSLCTLCLALLSDMPFWSRSTEASQSAGRVETASCKQFTSGYEQLKAGKADGCSFCALLHDHEQEHEAFVFSQRTERVVEGPGGPSDAIGPLDDYQTRYLLEDERLFDDGKFDIKLECLVREWSSLPDLGYLSVSLCEDGAFTRICELNILAEKDNPAANIITQRPLPLDLLSPRSSERVHGLIDECISDHKECPAVMISKLPHRVIDVGVEPPRLVIENAGNNSYVALSYCWGESQLIMLTTQSMSILTKGIDVKMLPRTIQDAITVTRRLRQQYLWVDALCVLQDDETARAQDISNMHDIYANAFITICASSAVKCSDGFLKDFTNSFPSAIRVPFHPPESTAGTILLRKQLSIVSRWRTPLDVRAWAYQEAALSPRKLIFDSIVYLECSHTPLKSRWMSYNPLTKPVEYEIFNVTLYFTPDNNNDQEYRLVAVDIFNGPQLSSALNESMIDAQDDWEHHVSQYSLRKLTREEDKLSAFAGLAAEFARRTGFRYLAGLWQETLSVDLLWQVSPPTRCTRLQTRRAPSWSWASVDGTIALSTIRDLRSHDSFSAPYFSEVRFVLEILTVVCTPVFNDSIYGENLEGVIRVRGYLIPVCYVGKRGFSEGFETRLPDIDGAETSSRNSINVRVTLDTIDDIASAEGKLQPEYWALPVTTSYHQGLVLSRCSPEFYRRVGCFDEAYGLQGELESRQSTFEPVILDII